MQNLIFIDCEAAGISPVNGTMTEFGAVHYSSRETFHGRIYEGTPDPVNPAKPVVGARIASDYAVAKSFERWLISMTGNGRKVMVSDNPAYDFMWIAGLFDSAGIPNPLGHSARRISDFYAGIHRDWNRTQDWKSLRITKHDHNPVNDAMGNVEAFTQIMDMIKGG